MMMTVETKFVVNPPFSLEITCTGLCPRLGFFEETFAVKSVWTHRTTVLVQPHSKSDVGVLSTLDPKRSSSVPCLASSDRNTH